MTGPWCLEVLDPGPLTTVQDLGRPGLAHLGVPPSGALDRASAGLANRLVGNPESAAVLETTLSGPRLRLEPRSDAASPGLEATVRLAVTGADAEVDVDGEPVDPNSVLRLASGQVLGVGRAVRGVRSYVAVEGGLAVPATLGSRATDLLSGLGPPVLRHGDRLAIGDLGGVVAAALDFVPTAAIPNRAELDLVLGPRDDWFTPGAVDHLAQAEWTVTAQSNRVGLRLHGPRLVRQRRRELPPEGLVTGAVQVPPDGQPVLFLFDHPTTGGYPVIGVVVDQCLPAAAQAAPGSTVVFRLLRSPLPAVSHG